MTPTLHAIVRHARALGWTNPRIAAYLAPVFGRPCDPGYVARLAMQAGCPQRDRHRDCRRFLPTDVRERARRQVQVWEAARAPGERVESRTRLAARLGIGYGTTYLLGAATSRAGS